MEIRIIQGDILEHMTRVIVLPQLLGVLPQYVNTSNLHPVTAKVDKYFDGRILRDIKSTKTGTSLCSVNVYPTEDRLPAKKICLVQIQIPNVGSTGSIDRLVVLQEAIANVIEKIVEEGERSCGFLFTTAKTGDFESAGKVYLSGIFEGLDRLESHDPFNLIDQIDLIDRNIVWIPFIFKGINKFFTLNNLDSFVQERNYLGVRRPPLISDNKKLKLRASWKLLAPGYRAYQESQDKSRTDLTFSKRVHRKDIYDVFISYRRDVSSETARLIQFALRSEGLKVFLDVDEMEAGHFDERLLGTIEDTPNFIVVLSKGCLQGHDETTDWLRKEIEHAIKTERNIIPIIMTGFNFPDSADLPQELRSLPRYNGVKYYHDYFDAVIARLLKYLTRDSPVAPPITSAHSTEMVGKAGEKPVDKKVEEMTRFQQPEDLQQAHDISFVSDFMVAKNVSLKAVSWLDAKRHTESLTAGGYSDWELPSMEQLKIIRQASLFSKKYCYWSRNEKSKKEAYYIHFDDGHTGIGPKTYDKGLCAIFVRAEEKASFYANLGASYYKLDRYDDAVAQFQKALALDPDFPNLYGLLGSALFQRGDLEGAIGAYQKQIERTPDIAEFYYNLGLAYQRKEVLDEAVQAYQKVTELNNHAVNAFRNLGYIFLKRGELSDAVNALKRAVEIDTSSWEDRYNLGVAFYRQGRYEEAIEAYKKAITLHSDTPDIHVALAKTYLKLNKTEAAMDHYEAALRIRPLDPEIHYELGLFYLQTGQKQKAMNEFHLTLRQNPNYSEARIKLADILLESGQTESALKEYRRVLQKEADAVDALVGTGIALIKQGKYENATDYLRVAESKGPRAKTHFYLALSYDLQNQQELARMEYEEAIKLDPTLAEAFFNLGVIFDRNGQKLEAKESYEKAISLNPDFAEAHNNLGTLYSEQGDIEKATRAYENAISFKPDFAEAYNNMGVICRRTGQLDRALESFEKATTFNPRFFQAYKSIATVFEAEGEYEGAVEAYQKTIEIAPQHEDAHFGLGASWQALGQIEKAKEAYQATLQVNPNNIDARFRLAEILASQGQNEEAVNHYQAILRIDPENADVLNNLGVFHFKERSYDEALRYLSKAVEIDPNRDCIHNNLGMLYAEMGMDEEAKSEFEKAGSPGTNPQGEDSSNSVEKDPQTQP